jgi:hypothetical protein
MGMGKDLWYKRGRDGKLVIEYPNVPGLDTLMGAPVADNQGGNKCVLIWPENQKITINGKSYSRNEISWQTHIDRPRVGRIFSGKAGINLATADKLGELFGITGPQLISVMRGELHYQTLQPSVVVRGQQVALPGGEPSPVRTKDIGPSWGHGFKD